MRPAVAPPETDPAAGAVRRAPAPLRGGPLALAQNAVLPITASGAWRGIADVIAVGFYLLGIVPLGGIALLELGVLGRGLDDQGHLKLHASFVGLFLIVAHIAMIFGMLNPALLMA